MKPNEQLTVNFALNEFTDSATANKLNIINSIPNGIIYNNIKYLVENIMQPLRDILKNPIKITSGYRCQNLNKAVGGAWDSQHLAGEACDFTVDNMSLRDVFTLIIGSSIVFDQCILERKGQKEPTWIHISVKRPNRRQAFEKEV